jgi:cell division protein ZapA
MSENNNLLSIKVLDRTYSIKCPEKEVQDLQEAAKLLDEEMRLVQKSASINNLESVAVIVALNKVNELFQFKKQKEKYIDEMHLRIDGLQNKIEKFLATEEEVAV